jgi:hypothetical protein
VGDILKQERLMRDILKQERLMGDILKQERLIFCDFKRRVL